MKPIYLDINCFGPHEHSVIDFRKLDESSIFLIGGDTGAGKSTIFDAMTFALFNSTTSDRDAKEMRSQFASPKQTTKIIFYFEQSGKIYKVERTPEQFLAKKNNSDGLTKRQPTASLSVVDDIGGIEIESIATKPVDVGHAISEILNLNADQFKKIILLPQNDFSEFLKSNTNDKEKILKKIFGTQLFTDFTTKLKDHYDKAHAKAANFETDLKSQTESLAWSEAEQTELAQTPNEQLIDKMDAYLKVRQQNLSNAQATEQILDKSWKKADKNYHAASEIQKNFDRLAESKQKYQRDILDQANDIKSKQAHVAQLDWARPLRETVRDLDKSQLDQRETIQNQQIIIKKLNDSKDKLEQANTEINSLTQQSTEFESKKAQAQKLTVLISKVQDIEKIRTDLALLQPQLTSITKNVQSQAEKIDQLKNNIETKKQDLKQFEELPAKKDTLSKERNQTVDTLIPLDNERTNSATDVAQLQTKLDKLHEDLKSKTAKLTVAKNDYQEKIKTRQSLMIAQLRSELEDGQPCAVCGATDHPFAEKIAIADDKELRRSMDAVDKSQQNFAAANSDVKNVQANISDVSDEFEQKQQAAVKAQMTLSSKYSELMANASIELPQEFDIDSIKESYQKHLDEFDRKIISGQQIAQTIKDLEQKQQAAQTELTQTNSRLDKISAEIQTRSTDLNTKINEIDDPEASSQELQMQKDQLNKAYDDFQKELKSAQETVHNNELINSKNQTKLADNKQQLDRETKNIKSLSEKLDHALAADNAKTNDLDTLNKWIDELNQNHLSNLKDIIASYNKEKEILTETIDKIKESLTNAEKPDLIKLKSILDDAEDKRTAAIKQTTNADKDFKDAKISFNKVQEIMQKQGDFAKELAAITSLYNVVNGKDGNDSKLKLETYVVQNYLQKILTYANATFLNKLSHNRYSFVISQKAADRQRDHGLDINIYDRETDAVRSSNTLSGGETFIAALSIALSLSEVVQSSANGVQIDALFVDEGFGSLDDETLDDAMSALEIIGSNRMVGVISHVDSMKQRIGQQLLVTKVGDGKSKIEIINK